MPSEVKDEKRKSGSRKRRSLREWRGEVKKVGQWVEEGRLSQAVEHCGWVGRGLRGMEEKEELVRLLLWESRAYRELGSLSKARTALVGARAQANAAFIQPSLQAHLDMETGIIHLMDDSESELRTASSYFQQALGNLPPEREEEAISYIILCGLSGGESSSEKEKALRLVPESPSESLRRMVALAKAAAKGGPEFAKALAQLPHGLKDPLIRSKLHSLRRSLLRQSIRRLIIPYTRVEMGWMAEKLSLSSAELEKAVSLMLLDGELKGYMDQERNILNMVDPPPPDPLVSAADSLLTSSERLLQHLHRISHTLHL